jgi:uncharacterized protein
VVELSPEQLRVLGTLIEKDMSTPDYYPMSLNALTNACNQKNNREPITNFDDHTVVETLEELKHKGLAMEMSGSGRVKKYSHRISDTLNLSNRELAVLSVMMLRGPQTVNELKDRTERLHRFDDAEAVESTLRKLMERQPEPLVIFIPKQTGMREPRYMHLLGGPVDVTAIEDLTPRRVVSADSDRIHSLETQLAELRGRVDKMEEIIRQFT